jgi:hypothetical protein
MFPMTAITPPATTSQAAASPASALLLAVNGDAAAAARQQMPSAVAASTNVAAYSPDTPQPPKPTLRNSGTSPLAAQYIGQTPGADEGDLAIFEAPVTQQASSAADEDARAMVADMRVARGDIDAQAQEVDAPTAAAMAAEIPVPRTPSMPFDGAPLSYSVAASSTQPIAARTTPAPLVLAGKKPGLAEAKGAAAYGLAAARNNTIRRQSALDAIG